MKPLLLVLIACTRCSNPQPPAPAPGGGEPLTPAVGEAAAPDALPSGAGAETPAPEQAPAIALESPAPGAQLAPGPVAVHGTASVWEGRLELELRVGEEVLDHVAVSTGAGAPGRGSFAGTLTVPSGRSGPATLCAYARSPMDGSPTHRVELAVTLE